MSNVFTDLGMSTIRKAINAGFQAAGLSDLFAVKELQIRTDESSKITISSKATNINRYSPAVKHGKGKKVEWTHGSFAPIKTQFTVHLVKASIEKAMPATLYTCLESDCAKYGTTVPERAYTGKVTLFSGQQELNPFVKMLTNTLVVDITFIVPAFASDASEEMITAGTYVLIKDKSRNIPFKAEDLYSCTGMSSMNDAKKEYSAFMALLDSAFERVEENVQTNMNNAESEAETAVRVIDGYVIKQLTAANKQIQKWIGGSKESNVSNNGMRFGPADIAILETAIGRIETGYGFKTVECEDGNVMQICTNADRLAGNAKVTHMIKLSPAAFKAAYFKALATKLDNANEIGGIRVGKRIVQPNNVPALDMTETEKDTIAVENDKPAALESENKTK